MSFDQAPASDLLDALQTRFGAAILGRQPTTDRFPVLWIAPEASVAVHRFLRDEIDRPFALLSDHWAIDETLWANRAGQPASGVTLVTHLTSLERNADIRIKIACDATAPRAPSLAGVYVNADWYEREAFDMFGVQFDGRDSHRRILMPPTWQGHPPAQVALRPRH